MNEHRRIKPLAVLSPRDHADALAKQLGLTQEQVTIIASEIRNALVPAYEFVLDRVQIDGATHAQTSIERVLALVDALVRLELDAAVG